MNAYLDFWKKAFDYKSEANRLTFLWILVLNILIITTLTFFETYILNDPSDGRARAGFMLLYGFATFIPMLALCARRLNSMKAPQAWLILRFIPIASVIFDLVLLLWPERDAAESHLEAPGRPTV